MLSKMDSDNAALDEESFVTDEASLPSKGSTFSNPINQALSNMKDLVFDSRLVGLQRSSINDRWNLAFSLSKDKARDIMYVSFAKDYHGDACDVINQGEVLVAINGVRVGMPSLKSMDDILGLLKQEVELLVEVQSALPEPDH